MNNIDNVNLSKYQKFVKAEFSKLQQMYPDKKPAEIMKMIATEWNVVR